MSKEIIINKSRIIEARLYSAGAQVVREASVEISAGDSKVLFTQLPFDIDPLSVSVMTSGAEMQSADFKINYLTDALVAPKTTDLKKGLKKAEDDLAQTDSKIAVLNFEKEMLDANRTLVGEDAGVKTDELKSAFEYLKNSFEKNRLEFLKLVKLKKEQTETLEKLKKELADNQSRPVPSGEIITEISAQKAGAVKFTLTYYVPKASWEPFYEARGEDNSNKVTLKLKAKIKQNTGELWEGVRIILSTGNPSSAVNQPELMPWYLRPNRPVRAQFQSFNASASMVKEEARMKSDAMGLTDTQVDSCLEYYDAEVVENISGTEFALSGLCSLPSFESKTFEVASFELPAEFKHYAVRKIDKDVFLLAHIKGWEKLNLLAAQVFVYFDSAYIGITDIDPRRLKETLKISFGRDKGVIVTRTKGRDYSGKQIFGSNTKTTVSFVLDVRNTKKRPIELTLVDQIPLSTDKTITVDSLEISGASYNKDRGELTWIIPLKPSEACCKTVKYSVTYPSAINIVLE